MRKLNKKELIIASHNDGKISEIKELLNFFDIKTVSSKGLNLIEPEENGSTFIENAIIKARSAAKHSNYIALSDDSGLEVHSLNNDPGIYSARWAGENKDFNAAMKKINTLLNQKGAKTSDLRKASFVCSLCICWPDNLIEYVEERVNGTIVWPPRGNLGFGYDSIFLPDNHTKTFGEMSSEEKHSWSPTKIGLSHRAKAFSKLVELYIEQ
jgi:XTP/dITP diphosphohydrolase